MKLLSLRGPKPLSQKVTELLRNAIIHGEFRQGERLNESSIAATLKISKSPVREALRNLESENLVESRSWKGTFVKKVSAKDIEEIYMVLHLIEGTITRLAASNMDDRRERELRLLIRELERAAGKGHIERNVVVARRLHDFIVQTSGNDLLMRIHSHLRTQELRFGSVALSGAESLTEVLHEHLAIAQALLEKDGEKAERMMVKHIRRARERALKTIDQTGSDDSENKAGPEAGNQEGGEAVRKPRPRT